MSTLNWFKSLWKKKEPIEEVKEEPIYTSTSNEVRALNLVNNTLTVFFKDGNVLSRKDASREVYDNVNKAATRAEVEALMHVPLIESEVKFISEREAEIRRKEETLKQFDVLKQSGDFIIKDHSIYFNNIDRSLPKLLVDHISKVLVEKGKDSVEYISLKRFWFWTCLNPRAEVADMLYNFLESNCLRLNKQGFFYALRNVVTVENGGDKKLVEFISESYTHIKAIWKKKPSNYDVWKDVESKEYKFFKVEGIGAQEATYEFIGNLETLYKDLPNMTANRYTDDRTKTFDIRVGQRVSMDPNKCSWSTADCGEAGLHFTMDEINYVGCGDTSVLVLINPMKVVGIGSSKGRCYEYLPIMVVNRQDVTKILHDKDFDTLELDEWYAEEELVDLENKAKTSFTLEVNKHDFNLSGLSSDQLHKLVGELSKIKEELKSRVVVA